jgi:hypothetical protein
VDVLIVFVKVLGSGTTPDIYKSPDFYTNPC